MTATTRVEHDSMGALEVPASALWGAQTQRAVQNFPATGLRMPRAFIRALGLIKHASAAANAELGDLPRVLYLHLPSAGTSTLVHHGREFRHLHADRSRIRKNQYIPRAHSRYALGWRPELCLLQ